MRAWSLLHGLACSPACSLALSILLPAHVCISPGGEEGTHASRHPPPSGGPSFTGRRGDTSNSGPSNSGPPRSPNVRYGLNVIGWYA